MKALRCSRSAAGRRIQAARAGRKFPIVFEMIESGDLSLVVAAMLQPHLSSENHERLLAMATRKDEHEVAVLVASIAPGRRRRESVRVVAVPTPVAPTAIAEVPPPVAAGPGGAFALMADDPVRASETEQVLRRIAFDVSADTFELIRRAKEVLRHRFPTGEMDDILRLALARLLDQEDRDRRDRPAAAWQRAPVRGGRHIPEAVKQAVWERDGGRCTFRSGDGHVCGSREWLEFDHIVPVALGGLSTVENVTVLCRAHNLLRARRQFGASVPCRDSGASVREQVPEYGVRGPRAVRGLNTCAEKGGFKPARRGSGGAKGRRRACREPGVPMPPSESKDTRRGG